MNELPCDVCTKTNNHCCKADIPLRLGEINTIFNNLPNDMTQKDFLIIKHNSYQVTKKFMLIHKSYNGCDINITDCIFLKNGKCSIYNYRPDICKVYGTDTMRCRYEASNITSEESIKEFKIDDIEKLDSISMAKTDSNLSNNFIIESMEKSMKEHSMHKDLINKIPDISIFKKKENNE